MPSLWPTLARLPRVLPDSARSSKTIATARSRSSAGCCFLDVTSLNLPRSNSLRETRGGPPVRLTAHAGFGGRPPGKGPGSRNRTRDLARRPTLLLLSEAYAVNLRLCVPRRDLGPPLSAMCPCAGSRRRGDARTGTDGGVRRLGLHAPIRAFVAFRGVIAGRRRPLCVRASPISGTRRPRTGAERPRTRAVGAVTPTVRRASRL